MLVFAIFIFCNQSVQKCGSFIWGDKFLTCWIYEPYFLTQYYWDPNSWFDVWFWKDNSPPHQWASLPGWSSRAWSQHVATCHLILLHHRHHHHHCHQCHYPNLSSAAEMKPLPSLSKTRNASRISSSLSDISSFQLMLTLLIHFSFRQNIVVSWVLLYILVSALSGCFWQLVCFLAIRRHNLVTYASPPTLPIYPQVVMSGSTIGQG